MPAAATPRWSPRLTLEAALSAIQQPASAGRPAAAARGRRPRGLRAGLWLLLAIGLVPSVVGTVVYLRQLHDIALRDAYAQADLVALSTSQNLAWLLQDAQATMASIAARPRVRALDAADCDPIFLEFRDLSPAYKALALRRLDGSSVCSELRRPPTQQSVASAPWFQAAVQSGGFHASVVHRGNVTGDWTVRLTHPVIGLGNQNGQSGPYSLGGPGSPGGRIEGLLVTPVDLALLQQRLYGKLPPNVLSAVVDGDNRVLVRSQRQDQRLGQPAAATVIPMLTALRQAGANPAAAALAQRQFAEVGIDGVRRLFALRSVPMTDWIVVAALPEADTLEGYVQARNRALALFAAVLLLVALVAWRVGHGIVEPMRGLARAARGVAAGDSAQRAPEHGPREVMEVAREFNRMVAAVQASGAQLQASERHYRALIENLPVAVVTHRVDGSIEVFNDRACELLQCTPEQMRDRGPHDRQWHFVDSEGRRLAPAEYPASRVLASRLPMLPETLGIVDDERPPGTADDAGAQPAPGHPHTWAMVTGYPQFDTDGRLQRAIVAFVDVTAQHQGEELRRAKDTAEAASKAKSIFLSRVSHELRTPLNAINGFSELMLLDDAVTPATKDRLRHVLSAGQHLLSLINQILDLTRIEAGQMRTVLRPLPLWPLVHECIAVCGPLAQERGVRIELPSAPAGEAVAWVQADATHLRQVLFFLLSNAIKYNRPQGHITVQVERRCVAAGEPDTVVRICDTGLGLTAEQMAGLFQPFHRGGAEFSGIEGHGLGLSISRLLAQALGGRIEAQSTPGEGSCFSLHLHGAPPAGG